jgi:elongation factor G
VLLGFPMVDMKVTLYEGACDEVHSSAVAFEIAARAAMREACQKGGVRLLEPVMDVEVAVPAEFIGRVIGDIKSRGGQLTSQAMLGAATVIRADVPLATMFGYDSALAAMLGRQMPWHMAFSRYQDVPSNSTGDDPAYFPPAVGMRA